MNKGSAYKWIDVLIERRAEVDSRAGCLKSLDGCMCPLGVLQDFIDPTGWKPLEYVGVYQTKDGSFAEITKDVQKKVKAKSQNGTFHVLVEMTVVDEDNGETYRDCVLVPINLVDAWDSGRLSLYAYTGVVEQVYEQL